MFNLSSCVLKNNLLRVHKSLIAMHIFCPGNQKCWCLRRLKVSDIGHILKQDSDRA